MLDRKRPNAAQGGAQATWRHSMRRRGWFEPSEACRMPAQWRTVGRWKAAIRGIPIEDGLDLGQDLAGKRAEFRPAMVDGGVVDGPEYAIRHVGRPGDL